MELKEKLRLPFKLKEVERIGYINGRHESTAEHTFSAITLAEYFIKFYPYLDELKVIKLLLYHDYPEIYAGDVCLMDEKGREKKAEREEEAIKRITSELPKETSKEIKELYKEYKERKTPESKFAKAIDCIDAVLQSLNSEKEWKEKGYTEEKIRKRQDQHLMEFPLIREYYYELLEEIVDKKFIPRK
jgi:putative hydrolase of HD superfamily